MKKKKQKIYNTEQEIVREIDAVKASQPALLQKAIDLEDESRQMSHSALSKEAQEMAQVVCNEAASARRKYERTFVKLRQLQDTLAAFRTELLPGVIENKLDRSVPLAKL